ncbi:MAG: aminopeptidase N [Alphaproteobacteria bacterium]|nr:aminopeptidase N [Alphaproteobacteria bacterium]
MRTDTPQPIRLEDYNPPEFLIDTVDLNVILHPTDTLVRAKLKLRPNPAVKRKAKVLRLDGEHIGLESLRLDKKELQRGAFRATKTGLTIADPPAAAFELDITTRLNPNANKALQGLYRSRGVYCTQCEAEGFRRITYFLDRPDILSTYRVRIEADRNETPVLLANGNLIETGTLEAGKRHYAVWQDPHPKPCYLFAMVGGDLGSIASSFTTMSGRQVALTIYVEHGKEDRAGWAMDSLKRSMRWDEEKFGREYDLDVFNIVAVSDFNMGAMENKGLNVFNDRLILASPETATDTMYAAIESVVAHEYFHNWTGNRITCRDWFQLCLKEGLTVYRDQEFSSDERSRVVQRIADVRQLKTVQFAEDAGPLAHPVRPRSYIEINNFYTATVYEKGAEVVRMLKTVIGPEAFRAGMNLYFERHDGDAATIEDYLACFAEASGQDLEQFALWYEQSGTPRLEAEFSYDRRTRTARLTLEQHVPPTPGQPKKLPMHIPVMFGMVGKDGRDIPLNSKDGVDFSSGLIHLTRQKQTFHFADVPERPVPSLLRGFSAPVNLRIDLADKDLEFLLAHDSDPFNRWQAANAYATRMMLQRVAALSEGKRSRCGDGFATALGKALSDEALEWAFKAELLQLPSETDIAREIGHNVDPEHIHAAQQGLSALVARRLEPQLFQIHEDLAGKGRFSADAEAAGRRAARNAALTLLVKRGAQTDLALAAEHYFSATTMTEAAHALTLLAGSNAPQRNQALADFHERWKDDHVVIDTWFAAQAQSPRPTVIGELEALMSHATFDITAPNKIRSLIGSFILRNAVQFNRADGAGYRFAIGQILTIDKFNPQIAARLLNGFKSWRTLEPVRRKAAKKALDNLAGHAAISRDTREIVSRILQR